MSPGRARARSTFAKISGMDDSSKNEFMVGHFQWPVSSDCQKIPTLASLQVYIIHFLDNLAAFHEIRLCEFSFTKITNNLSYNLLTRLDKNGELFAEKNCPQVTEFHVIVDPKLHDWFLYTSSLKLTASATTSSVSRIDSESDVTKKFGKSFQGLIL